MQPLDGLRVIDLSHVLAGPFCSYQLALLGADVIRIDNPAGRDMVRFAGPNPEQRAQGLGPGFMMQNAGKRSLALNLKDPRGRRILEQLLADADVMVENYRPGVLARLGLAPERLRGDFPRLICCSITGFGQDGPMAGYPAYDHMLQAVSGMMAANATDDGRPRRIGFPLIDYITGLLAAFAVVSALQARHQSGQGVLIDVSMLQAALITIGPLLAGPLTGFVPPPRRGDRAASGSPFSGMFAAADGHFLGLAANTPAQAEALCAVIDRPDLTAQPGFARWAEDPDYVALVQDSLSTVFAGRPAADWERALGAANVPAARVRSVAEIITEPQVTDGGFLRTVAPGPGLPAPPPVPGVGFSLQGGGAQAPTALAPPPRPGAQTRELLTGIGYGDDDLVRLRGDGVIAWPDDDPDTK